MSNASEYLTMARIMKAEWEKYRNANKNFRNMTGFEQIHVKEAFQAGFMKGFEGKYFHEGD